MGDARKTKSRGRVRLFPVVQTRVLSAGFYAGTRTKGVLGKPPRIDLIAIEESRKAGAMHASSLADAETFAAMNARSTSLMRTRSAVSVGLRSRGAKQFPLLMVTSGCKCRGARTGT